MLLVFWRLLALPMPWIAGLFYIWVSVFSVLVVTLFWLVANDLYRPREAKRLFGFIGSGGILGGVVGSFIASIGARVIGTEHLLLLSAAVLVLCWVVVQQLWDLTPERAAAEDRMSPQPRRDTFLSNMGGFVNLLFESRYLLLLIAVVGLSKLIGSLVYYQFNPFIEEMFPEQDARTAFLGNFFSVMNLCAFVVQFFFTSWILRRWGVFTALLVLPLGLFVGSIGLIFIPLFWLAATMEMFDGSLGYSLQQTSKEMLYLPIDRSIRYKVKPFIDMVVFRFGKGIAALIGIIMLGQMHLPAYYLSYIAVPLAVVWIVAVFFLRQDYVARIRTILQARAALTQAANSTSGGSQAQRASVGAQPNGVETSVTSYTPDYAMFGSLTNGHTSKQKLALMDQLVGTQESMSVYGKELLAEMTTYEIPPKSSRTLTAEPAQLKRVITDQNRPMALRCQAVQRLARGSSQEVVDYLFGVELIEADAALRHEALRALVRIRLGGRGLEFPTQQIRRQIAREVANYQRIVHVAEIYRQHGRGPLTPDDPLIGLLRVLLEESVEQIFRLLLLLYRPADIHLVYEQLQIPETYIRADAIELLDNLIDARMRVIIAPILDEDRFLSLVDREPEATYEPDVAYRMLQGAIWDHNSWLSVTTLCAVGRLGLPTMRGELERASRDAIPLVAKAARVALHLTPPSSAA